MQVLYQAEGEERPSTWARTSHSQLAGYILFSVLFQTKSSLVWKSYTQKLRTIFQTNSSLVWKEKKWFCKTQIPNQIQIGLENFDDHCQCPETSKPNSGWFGKIIDWILSRVPPGGLIVTHLPLDILALLRGLSCPEDSKRSSFISVEHSSEYSVAHSFHLIIGYDHNSVWPAFWSKNRPTHPDHRNKRPRQPWSSHPPPDVCWYIWTICSFIWAWQLVPFPPVFQFLSAFPGQPFQLHLRLQMIAGLSLFYKRQNCCRWSPIFFLPFFGWSEVLPIHFSKDIHKFVSPSLSQIFISKFALKRCSSKTSDFARILTYLSVNLVLVCLSVFPF